MQHLYGYNQKPSSTGTGYKTLLGFFAKLLLIVGLTILVMLINISKSSAKAQLHADFTKTGKELTAAKVEKNMPGQ